MDTVKVAEFLDVPYYTIDYLVRIGVINPGIYGKGKARQFEFDDLVLSALAVLLRQDGYKAKDIKKALDIVKDNWDGSKKMGSLMIDKQGNFYWQNSRVISKIDNRVYPVYHLPKYHYGVADIAKSLKYKIKRGDKIGW